MSERFICTNCGEQKPIGTRFCSKCIAPVKGVVDSKEGFLDGIMPDSVPFYLEASRCLLPNEKIIWVVEAKHKKSSFLSLTDRRLVFHSDEIKKVIPLDCLLNLRTPNEKAREKGKPWLLVANQINKMTGRKSGKIKKGEMTYDTSTIQIQFSFNGDKGKKSEAIQKFNGALDRLKSEINIILQEINNPNAKPPLRNYSYLKDIPKFLWLKGNTDEATKDLYLKIAKGGNENFLYTEIPCHRNVETEREYKQINGIFIFTEKNVLFLERQKLQVEILEQGNKKITELRSFYSWGAELEHIRFAWDWEGLDVYSNFPIEKVQPVKLENGVEIKIIKGGRLNSNKFAREEWTGGFAVGLRKNPLNRSEHKWLNSLSLRFGNFPYILADIYYLRTGNPLPASVFDPKYEKSNEDTFIPRYLW